MTITTNISPSKLSKNSSMLNQPLRNKFTESWFYGNEKSNFSLLSNLEVPSPELISKLNSEKKQREKRGFKKIVVQETDDNYMKVTTARETGYQSTPATYRERAIDDLGKKQIRGRNTHGSQSTRNHIASARNNVISPRNIIIPEKLKKSYKTKQFTLNSEIYTPRNNQSKNKMKQKKTISLIDFEALSRAQSNEQKEQNLGSKKMKVIAGHAMSVRDNKSGTYKDHKLYSNDIIEKEFGADDNEGHDAALWKNREKDWYNAERRFIFATKNAVKRDKWIQNILKQKAQTRHTMIEDFQEALNIRN